jgi:mannose-6-phosphate isomerase class I
MDIRPYIVVPKFIEQPTWGGAYIANFKNWANKPFSQTKIGQSYELSSTSLLSEFTDSNNPSFAPEISSKHDGSFLIQDLIDKSPQKVLGENSMKRFGNSIKTLIKFTQAKGNSFQLHVKDGNKNTRWLPKPESWYYLERGLATIGISNLKKLEEYKQSALRIETIMRNISDSVISGKTSLSDAQKQANDIISKENIYQFVNTIPVPANAILDIHEGGIHHSWEEDETKYPDGNIVYEVQVEASDEASTIRSFDKGKIKDDGSIRPVQIDDYFTYLDTSEYANSPLNFLKKEETIIKTDMYATFEIFNTPYYSMHKIVLNGEMKSSDMKSDSFHHLFVLDGSVDIKHEQTNLTVGKGHSAFIPASCNFYLTSQKTQSILLSTFI